MGVTGIGIGIGIGPFDLGGASAFSPLSLFAGSEEGAWYDPSDLSTLWQDSAGTTPVTATDQPVGRIDDKSGNGNHAIQATAAARPLYKTSGGLHWLEFDGVDDFLTATATFSSGDKAVGAGLERLGAGTGTEANTVSGFYNGSGYYVGFATDTGPKGVYRVNDVGGATSGQIVAQSVSGAFVGVGNYGTAALGEVNSTTLSVTQGALSRTPATIQLSGSAITGATNRKVFGLICLGRSLTTAEVASLKAYLAEKSGVTL